ncbi:unnamed protein product [Fusarium graminearum]|nr:unnamed protein product [Fusarium graminearum]CAG2014186.1 unnamed protein product [Fusarium graminearum]
MVLFRCLAVAAALCHKVSAGPCRPHRDSTTTNEFSGATLAFESSVLVDTTAPTSTSITHSSVETVSSSYISTYLAVATMNTLLDEMVTSVTLSSRLGDEISILSEMTDAETPPSNAEQKETTTAQPNSSSEDPSVTASHQASAGTETSIAEINSFEIISTVPSSIETTTDETTKFETTIEPQPTNYFINRAFEIPDDGGEYTGALSLLGRSVIIKTDSSHALSGTPPRPHIQRTSG